MAGALLAWPPIVYIGRVSYGLYLFHVVPSFLGWPVGPADAGALARFAAYFLVSIAVASISWRLFEKPINDLKRHIPYVSGSRIPKDNG